MKSYLCLFLLSLLLATMGQAQGTTIYADDFEAAQLNSAHWTARPSLSGSAGLVELADGIGLLGSRGIQMGKSVDGSFTTNALDLKLNLAGQEHVKLSFWIYDNQDETHLEDGLYFSNDNGASFKKVLDFRPADWCDYRYGQFPPIDVSQLAAGSGLALTSQFVIRFQQHDDGDFYGSPDGIFLDDVRVYAQPPVYASLPFCDDFETGQLGDTWAWRFPGQTNTLASVPARPSDIVGVYNGSGYNSEYGVAMGKDCDDGFATTALDLHLNLAGLSQVEMTFWIYDNQDETQVDDGLYFSNDGGQEFVKVLDFRPADWCDYRYGQLPPIDIAQLAADAGLLLTSQFVIRFQQHDDSDFYGSPDGFQLDDVCVYVPDRAYAVVTPTTPFCDDFETGQLGSAWAWRFADLTNTLAAVPTRPSNLVGVYSGYGHNGSQYAVAMGKDCDDGFATNALDLHLNLAGLSQVEMTFWIYDNQDETQADDGLYFSDNGGASFKKVFDFRPADWCDYQYGQFPPLDIDQLAEQHGLELTSTFIIRFQQHDDSDFYGSPDGFYLDDVCVYVPELVYAPLPFFDDFETGQLGKAWAWRFADQTALPAENVTRPSNIVGVYNGIGNNSEFAVAMGKDCDDGFATNALDLHLNLFGASDVALTFDLNNWSEETQIQDGIYFSDNGGINFIKVYDFDFSAIPSYQYIASPVLDVDALVSAHGLELTGQFVIRFQQHDDGDFYGSPDGYYLDNINVSGMTTATPDVSDPNPIMAFPNPATDRLFIRGLPVDGHPIGYRILDAHGRMLGHGELTASEADLDISGLPAGLLVLEFRQGEMLFHQKVLKQ
ncbi:MAG: T9SS type A sorting domain-containing protein [Phaeodactylibacter sp.]|nr:T9SS type A sorting domain-containing protein [Phaeodactylibacter sp.]